MSILKVGIARLYRDEEVRYQFSMSDQLDRFHKKGGTTSFEDMCIAIKEGISQWHAPRRNPPSNIEMTILALDEEEITQQQAKGYTAFPFTKRELNQIRLLALNATVNIPA